MHHICTHEQHEMASISVKEDKVRKFRRRWRAWFKLWTTV